MGRVLAVIIWIITLLSVLLFVAGKWWFPEAISEHAPALDRQFLITIVGVGIAFPAAPAAPSPLERGVWAGWFGRIATPARKAIVLFIHTAAIVSKCSGPSSPPSC